MALPLEPEPVVEEPLARIEPAPVAKPGAKGQGIKTIPARVAAPAPPPPSARTAGKAPVAQLPRVVPVKAVAKPIATIKAPAAKPATAVGGKPTGAALAKGTAPTKVAPGKLTPAKVAAKPVAKPAAKGAAKSVAKTAKPLGRVPPKSKSSPQAANGRPAAKSARPAPKPAARPVAKAAAKPVAKRK